TSGAARRPARGPTSSRAASSSARCSRQSTASSGRAEGMTRPLRVVVIEDSLTVRKRIVEVLSEASGIEVVGEASDGPAGIELCERLRPDVVTLDMVLPGMSGLEVTEHLMAYCPTPILIVSASTN